MIVCLINARILVLVFLHFIIILNQCTGASGGYCDIKSCGNKPHTMCQYPNSGPSSNCKDYEQAPLSSSEKNAIVNRHNKFRQKIADGLETRGNPGPQPRAINMTMLKWDDELAIVAQRWADQCTSGHDKCRDVDRFYTGQNIATVWSTGKINKKVENLVDDWYNEVKFFSRYWVDSFKPGTAWGHYSQVVWAKSLTVGCGQVKFWDTARRMNTLRLICNYGPGGNFLNEPVYISLAHRTAVINPFFLFLVVFCCIKIREYLPV